MPSNAKKNHELRKTTEEFMKTLQTNFMNRVYKVLQTDIQNRFTGVRKYRERLSKLYKNHKIGFSKFWELRALFIINEFTKKVLKFGIKIHNICCSFSSFNIQITYDILPNFHDRFGKQPGLPTNHTPMLKVFKKTVKHQLPIEVINIICDFVCMKP